MVQVLVQEFEGEAADTVLTGKFKNSSLLEELS